MPIPPKNIQKNAKRALDTRKELPSSRQYGTRVGLARANQLANGENISPQTLLRMRSFLLRAKFEYDRARDAGKTMETSKAIGAYYLWGGPGALSWVNSEIKR